MCTVDTWQFQGSTLRLEWNLLWTFLLSVICLLNGHKQAGGLWMKWHTIENIFHIIIIEYSPNFCCSHSLQLAEFEAWTESMAIWWGEEKDLWPTIHGLNTWVNLHVP